MIECIDFHGFNGICDNAVKNFNALPELSPRATEDLIAVFGCPKLEVKDPDEIRPPSPSCASQNAQSYMKKLVKEQDLLMV